ncbi:3-hydroxyacyl-CoA dehydrogenase NAD-binding domain-containing protein [Burkholderia ubonensis]|uniref:3-hydroxyacyl-CoA dehydrogenase NAD-binding domain-containing protein n=1 Tax=Burkholderia ubonensis TaxID=101571 RepID=UPI002AB1C028|nr:3-hydroxyacyl-CoA dehydrogenase NAD-binding domain-containing protein [Burkholderia ubonensis]
MGKDINRIAIIGTGVIGASWAALFLARGLDVVATDIAPDAEPKLRAFVDAAWPALEQFGLAPGASRSRLQFTANLDEAVIGSDFVQENGPERIDFKKDLYKHLDAILAPDAIIASSSSGLTMSEIQSACERHPERCVIGHPFNPPHLIPLVEIVGGAKTSRETIQRATAFYTRLGKKTIQLNKEVPGHVANRLQAALWREIVHLIAEDVVSVKDADTAVCWGPGLRWGIMGPNMLFHLGGGQGGIEHFFDQFTGPMTAWWKVLGSPQITPELRRKVVAGVLDEVDGQSIDQLAARRDEILLGLLSLRREGT